MTEISTASPQDATQAFERTKTKTMNFKTDREYREQFLDFLGQISGEGYSADDGVAYHAEPKNKISLPEGMSAAQGSAALADVATAQAQTEQFSKVFKFRPKDGAHAVVQVMRQFFGTTGRGLPIRTLFGVQPPQQITIDLDAEGTTAQVPWGQLEFSPLEGKLIFDSTYDNEYGLLFQLSVQCPKRYGPQVAGFFNLVEAYLQEHSIYKGKSIKGTDEPVFIPTGSDTTIVYNKDVTDALQATVWGVIKHAEMLKGAGAKVNKRVLLEGPFGTGKSEAGRRTAQVANEHGWTFIQFLSGEQTLDELESTLRTARLYAPSVVFVEDIDQYAKVRDDAFQSRLTNMIDGLGSKGDQVMVLMTSNEAAAFSKGMLRAGRIDRMIHVGPLDKDATKEVLRRVIGSERLGVVDYDLVWEAMDGFEPAFVRTTFDQAKESAMMASGSATEYTIGTDDFIVAANLLRPQWELHHQQAEKSALTVERAFSTLFGSLFEKANVQLVNGDGDDTGTRVKFRFPVLTTTTDAEKDESEENEETIAV